MIEKMKSWIGLRPDPLFAALLCVYGVVIVFTYQDYGINPDELGHMTYGRSVVHWYLSGFQERRIFSGTNTWLYGGFFDTVTYLVMQASPYGTVCALNLSLFCGVLK